jgi:lipid II:glycine glycyltransferase (peptidoglycan interpeptide bridge formation enzyme)
MTEGSPIQYVPHDAIDIKKWDACIDTASNGLVYGYSFYLDHMAKHWDALVLNDYEAVMPLTWNKKYGISYLYQPFLTAQLGVFGKNVTPELTEAFLKAIPAKFRYWDIYLNYRNVFPLQRFKLYQRNNYVLHLNKPYEELYGNYRENIQRNIRRAEQSGCKVVKGFDVEQVITLAVAQMRNYSKEAADNTEQFRKLYQHLNSLNKATTYGILSSKEELIASCVFLFSHNRAYYILVGNHPNGRTIGASHALIDAFIKDHAGKEMLLDFEGSDIRNLAFFYSSFGAMEEKYAGIRLNRLPFYLKWLKRN